MLRRGASSLARVGFVGLGNMGARMAPHLMKGGAHTLTVCDVNPAAAQELEKLGANVVTDLGELGANSDAIVTMLPNASIAQEVYLGEKGLLSGTATSPTILMDCSTIEPEASRKIADGVSEKWGSVGAQFVDAPVSGGVGAAAAGTLTFLVGGEKSAFEEAKKYLELMGKATIHCGDKVGSGEIVKVCNNMMLAISMSGMSEVLLLGQRMGADPKLLVDAINKSSGQCWVSSVYCPVPGVMESVPSSNNYDGGFMAELMLKDANLAMAAAEKFESPMIVAKQARDIFDKAVNQQGLGKKDFGVVFKMLNDLY